MDLGSLLVLLKLAGDMEFTVSPKTNGLPPPTHRILNIGESCPQDNTSLPIGTGCINSRVQPILK